MALRLSARALSPAIIFRHRCHARQPLGMPVAGQEISPLRQGCRVDDRTRHRQLVPGTQRRGARVFVRGVVRVYCGAEFYARRWGV